MGQYDGRPQSIPVAGHEQNFYRYAAPNNYPQGQAQRVESGSGHGNL